MTRRKFIFDVASGLMLPVVASQASPIFNILTTAMDYATSAQIGSISLLLDPSVAGSSITTSAGSTPCVDNDLCGKVLDQSGNGFNALQSVSGSRPTYRTGILNGLPIIRFSGSVAMNNTASIALVKNLAGATASCVVKFSSVAAASTMFYVSTSTGTTTRLNLAATVTPKWATSGRRLNGDTAETQTQGIIGAVPDTATSHFIMAVYDYANNIVRLYCDNVEIASTLTFQSGSSGQNVDNSNCARMAWGCSSADTTQRITGDLGETCVFSKALSTVERNGYFNFVRSKWGTP